MARARNQSPRNYVAVARSKSGRKFSVAYVPGSLKPPKRKVAYRDENLGRQVALNRVIKSPKKSFYEIQYLKDPTSSDWETLRVLLGEPYEQISRATVIRYVEFASQLASGIGTLDRWKIREGYVFLSRAYFLAAIEMAKTGENHKCRALDEIAASFGDDGMFDFLAASLPPLPTK